MSVLIKGMEKPEHCGYCRFRYDGICHALQKTQYSMNECPLVVIDDAGLNDTISRQAAIDALGGEPIAYTEYEQGLHDKWIDAKENIEALPSAQQWIPCSERLPEPIAPSQTREWFITSNQYGGVATTCYEFEASPFKEGWQTNMTILAWMPLPKPYEAEGK